MRATLLALLAAAPSAWAALQPAWRTVTLPSGPLSLMTYGAPLGSGARTLLLLHGFPEGSYTWWPVLSTGLLDAYSVVAPDMPGFNGSFTPSEDSASFLVPRIASVVEDLIAYLGGRVDVAAHDWGGGIAWWLASAQLPSITTLTVLNMAHPLGWQLGVRSVEAQQRASAYVLTFIHPGFSAILTANHCSVLRSWFAGAPWFTPAMEAALLRSWETGGEPGSVNAGLGWYRSNIQPHCPLNCTSWDCFKQGINGTFDAMPNNGTVKMPVRVLWGMLDTAFANSFQLLFMRSKVADLEITEFPNASHWIAQEIPLEVASEIAAFLKKH